MNSDHRLVVKDAVWQLFGRIISALFGFFITKIISSYLWPLRYGDYGTIFRYFARWTALVDFGLYVIAVTRLGKIKEEEWEHSEHLKHTYHQFLGTRVFMIIVIYTLAICVAYLIPAYTSNPFIVWGLPLAMLYSASNMFVGIQQLPLQLFWKMNRLSRSLIIARISQLVVLIPAVYFFFQGILFDDLEHAITPTMILAFCAVIFSVVASALGQNIDVHLRSKELLPFKIVFDKTFIKDILKQNRKYWFAYFFSSFHTLIVLMFLWWIFPTSEGFEYSWYWALSLSLIELLLIIPSSLGNSLLHKIPNYSDEEKKKSLGNLLNLVLWIGGIIAINFWIFSKEIIPLISSEKFLGTRENRWSDQILPFLWIVLVLSFIKQVLNYLFVALGKQNILFGVNLMGIVLWILVWIWVIPQWNLIGGVITQIFIECLFTLGALWIWKKEHLLPLLPKKNTFNLLGMLWGFLCCGILIKYYVSPEWFNLFHRIASWSFLEEHLLIKKTLNLLFFGLIALVINLPFIALARKTLKHTAKGLTKTQTNS